MVNDIVESGETAPAAEIELATTEGGEAQDRHRRTATGVVVSTKMDKTAVISVTRIFLHPKYRKYVRRRKKYMAHDEHGQCAVGDQVVIEECRPMSKHKRWRFKTTLRKKLG